MTALLQPARREFAQRGQPLGGVEAGQRTRGGAWPQDVGIGDAGAQLLWGDVEELDFVGGGHDRVGHRLVLGDAGDCFDGVVEAVDVLHVERGDHIDTGG